MKKRAKLLVLIAALAVLSAAWFLAESMAGRFSKEPEEEDVPSVIELGAGNPADIQRLTWTWQAERVSLSREEGSGRWINTEDETCPIDQTAVQPLLAAAGSVTADMTVPDVENFAQYGLDRPSQEITVETEDHTVVYEIGNMSLTGQYYLRVDGGSGIYLESGALASAFQTTLSGLLSLETLPRDIAAVNSISMETDVESYELSRRAEAAESRYGDAGDWAARRGEDWLPADEEQAEALCDAAVHISLGECVSWDAEDLAFYGLDSPQGVLTVSYESAAGTTKTFSLEFGDYAGDGVYVRLAGSKTVYRGDGAILDGFMYPEWEKLTPLRVCPVDWSLVTGANIEMDGYTFEVERFTETRTAESDDGTAEPESTDYFVSNGWTLEPESVREMQERISGFAAESLAGTEEGREELGSAVFFLQSETRPEVRVELWSYDSVHDLCIADGTAYLVSRTEAEELIAAAEQLLIKE